jgi:hypothetical protein
MLRHQHMSVRMSPCVMITGMIIARLIGRPLIIVMSIMAPSRQITAPMSIMRRIMQPPIIEAMTIAGREVRRRNIQHRRIQHRRRIQRRSVRRLNTRLMRMRALRRRGRSAARNRRIRNCVGRVCL